MAEPIEIIIRKGTGGAGDGFGIPGAKPKGRDTAFGTELAGLQKKEESENKRLERIVIGYTVAQTLKAMNYSLSQYGNITGNYIQQAGMQLGMEMSTTIVGMATSIGAAAAINPGLGFVTAAVSIGSVATNFSYQYRTLQTNITKLNTYANIMQERSGNVTGNGSRGTDY